MGNFAESSALNMLGDKGGRGSTSCGYCMPQRQWLAVYSAVGATVEDGAVYGMVYVPYGAVVGFVYGATHNVVFGIVLCVVLCMTLC